jgi:hypothetical protein
MKSLAESGTPKFSVDVKLKKRDSVDKLIKALWKGEPVTETGEIEDVICEFGWYRNTAETSQLSESRVKEMQSDLAALLGNAFYCWALWQENGHWRWRFYMRLVVNHEAWALIRGWCYQGRFSEMTVVVDSHVSVMQMGRLLPVRASPAKRLIGFLRQHGMCKPSCE